MWHEAVCRWAAGMVLEGMDRLSLLREYIDV